MKFEEIEYTVPTWTLPALFNGDTSGMSDEDEAALNAFLKTVEGQGHWATKDDDEPYFSHSNDVTNLGDEVVDIYWMQRVED